MLFEPGRDGLLRWRVLLFRQERDGIGREFVGALQQGLLRYGRRRLIADGFGRDVFQSELDPNYVTLKNWVMTTVPDTGSVGTTMPNTGVQP